MAESIENVPIVTPKLHTYRDSRALPAVLQALLSRLLERWTAAFLRWREIRNSRRALNRLTADQLRDIGLTRAEARREYQKSYYVE